MLYRTGEPVATGDMVDIDGMTGVVVFAVDRRDYSDEYPEAEWSYLGAGVGVLTEEAGLVHVLENENLTLIKHRMD